MTGDHRADPGRDAVLGRVRARLAGGVPTNLAHPAPAPSPDAPDPRSLVVDPEDLVGTFARTAAEAGAVVHRCPVAGPAEVDPGVLAAIVAGADRVTGAVLDAADASRSATGSRSPTVVASADPEAQALRPALEALGCRVDDHAPSLAAGADLGVTGSVAAVAATGSVVLDAAQAGGRGASLLPPAHLCVVRASTVVAHTGDVLRPLAGDPRRLPSNLVLVTGPSRTGDIEQILTVGVHGPATVHVLLLDRA